MSQFQPKGYVDTGYLQATAALLAQQKRHTYELMRAQPGHKVLDVGCGTGADTLALAQVVGSTGFVVGVDFDQGMIAHAKEQAHQTGISAWVEHKQADAGALPLQTGEFDACRSERLFQHLPDPMRALTEMKRVTRAGGWIVVSDTDWATLSIDSREPDIERRLVRVKAEQTVHNGYSGRQLWRLFKHCELANIAVEIVSVPFTNYRMARQLTLLDETEATALKNGAITNDELQRWQSDLEQADAEGTFFCSLSGIVAAGQKN
jgi:ubiquinone/menaquinone biosynthesis C-methylase UbiE